MANTWHTCAEEAGGSRAHKDSGGDDVSPYEDREQREAPAERLGN